MQQRLLKIVWVIILITIVIILICTWWTATAVNPNSEKIAELSYDINELETHKNICLDNLPYKESIDNANWIHTYCNMYDEIIMAYQEELEKLKERRPESETETAGTAEVREPWMLTESWDSQVMPEIQANTEHEKFKELAKAYGLDPSVIRNVENHYWIKEWVILCITVAETSWGKRWAWGKNIWSVWSNDRGNRPTYALMEAWLEAIWQTLNNRYLWKVQTLGCLSNRHHCQSWDDRWYRYATSSPETSGAREPNMVACLSKIYWTIEPATFNIRR